MGLSFIAINGGINVRRKIWKLFCVTCLLVLFGAQAVYAEEILSQNDNQKQIEGTIQPRSRYLASGISEITNKGNGVLHIYADFASYNSVPWAQLTIKLERTKSASGSWSHVKTYTYTFEAKDQPDGILIYGSADFDTSAFSSGYYYRLTCTHKVKTPSGSYESKVSQTDGVLLTPYPDFRSLAKPN